MTTDNPKTEADGPKCPNHGVTNQALKRCGPGVLFKTCVAMKFVDDDDDNSSTWQDISYDAWGSQFL